ncbi:unnamed protein product [Anisakis simplex]|uniref:Transmembrane protein n=1 Tax=Anisakis simplex TaxID=6269 RepID=A0A0M3JJP8_ANISI|nr:unnamed protein product [Anisakis simplex]
MAASDEDVKVLQDKCKKDCAKSFNQSQEREACSFGCVNQPNGNSGSVEVSMSEKDPMFKVVQSEMDKAISRMFGDMPMMFGYCFVIYFIVYHYFYCVFFYSS